MKEQATGHPLEWDLLGYVDGNDDSVPQVEIEKHVSSCLECRERANGLLNLVQRLSQAQRFIQPDNKKGTRDMWRDAIETAKRRVDAELAEGREAEEVVGRVLEASPRPPIADLAGLSVAHLQAARAIARDLGHDPGRAREIVEWTLAAPADRIRPSRSADPEGVRGMLLTTRANISRIEGYPKRALADLDSAKPLLEDGLSNPDIEIAYWWWVRSQALDQRGKFDEALAGVDRAEQIYGLYGDESWIARCQIVRAILFSNLGRRREAIEIFESLVSAGNLEPRLLESTHINLAFNLVLSDRLDEARSRYATATQLLLRSGQEHRLIRVRAGLAEIARREGRFPEAMEILEGLEVDYRQRGLALEEVVGDLDIASVLCEMGRFSEAAESCRIANARAVELGFAGEVIRALEVLATTSAETDRGAKISSIRDFVRGFELNREEAWSAA